MLGSAAGGGLPQWNCGCANCRDSRAGRIPGRTQSCLALSADGARWLLVNASPDLAAQLARTPELAPVAERATAVESILVTNADLDHVLGLFSLREGGGIAVQATAAVREALSAGLRLDAVLAPFGGVRWSEPGEAFEPLRDRRDEPTGLACRAIPLPGGPPLYAPDSPHSTGHSVALEFRDERTGTRALVAPDLAEATPRFCEALAAADAVFLDGTFWSSDELARVRPGARTAEAMGHLPIANGTLALMRAAPGRFKVYVHINNTNPILQPDSAERAAVESAGAIVGEDTWTCDL